MSELLKKRGDIINQFNIGNIITKSEILFDAPEKITKSLKEKKSKEESNRPIPIWINVSEERFNLIKQIINENKNLDTTINNQRYTLKGVNNDRFLQ